MFTADYMSLIQKAESLEDLSIIAEKMSSGDIQYAYPYQLKLLLIEYSKLVLKLVKNVDVNK